MIKKIRKYGAPPFRLALIHGGPGAAGEMAPVADVLSEDFGVLEPLQTVRSLDGQVEELRAILEKEGGEPIVLAGFSWGAWLAFIFAARHPGLVKKLVLISSGPFDEKYAHTITEARFARLNAAGRAEAGELIKLVEGPDAPGRDQAFERLGKLLGKTDAYDPEPDESGRAENTCAGTPAKPGALRPPAITLDVDIFQKVWKEAAEFRRCGCLIACAGLIKCPVTAIHGDYDPHPAEGVRGPLASVIKNFNFILLKECGHKPWIEKTAKGKFYEILKNEILS